MPMKAVLFDLDGTLLDTLADLADAANRVLAQAGMPTHIPSAYRRFVGDGSRMLMTRALPEGHRSAACIDACLAQFKEDYGRHWRNATCPYPGIDELLQALTRRRIPCAVVTNKPHVFAERCVRHFFPQTPFRITLGQQAGLPLKPHPGMALAAARGLQTAAQECLFLGDSGVDMETARAAGMLPVGAAWGFRTTEELIRTGAAAIVRKPGEVLEWFAEDRSA
jgi:phosphoglycolate phosphatase